MLPLKLGYGLTSLLMRPHQDLGPLKPIRSCPLNSRTSNVPILKPFFKAHKISFPSTANFCSSFHSLFHFFFFFFFNSSVTTSEQLHNSWLLLFISKSSKVDLKECDGLSHHNNEISLCTHYIYYLEYSHPGLHNNCYFTI